jgi:ethanolamine ammonia-lyase small subunit
MDGESTFDPAQNSQNTPDLWTHLRRFTDARIGLGRCGIAQPLKANLDFRLAHARARDAVHAPFAPKQLVDQIQAIHPSISLNSAAVDRQTYLTRPDLGRRLDPVSLETYQACIAGESFDLSLVVADGLSAKAIENHALAFIQTWLPLVAHRYRVAPIPVISQGRVAVADEVAALAGATLSIILIGERPGLSAPDSMGIYLTYAPKVGNKDDKRNCISNIRAAGLSIADAVRKTCYLTDLAIENKFSGFMLKDNMPPSDLPLAGKKRFGETADA